MSSKAWNVAEVHEDFDENLGCSKDDTKRIAASRSFSESGVLKQVKVKLLIPLEENGHD